MTKEQLQALEELRELIIEGHAIARVVAESGNYLKTSSVVEFFKLAKEKMNVLRAVCVD